MKKETKEKGVQIILDLLKAAYKKDNITKSLMRFCYVHPNKHWVMHKFLELVESGDGKLNPREFAEIIFDEFQKNIYNSISTPDVAEAILDVILDFWSNFDKDWEILLKYKDFLLSKRRQLAKKDKWGDLNFDNDEWRNFIIEFSEEKLFAGKIDSTIKSMPINIRDEIKSAGISQLGLLVSLACLHDKDLSESEEIVVDKNISSGRDFEVFIKEKIEENFPSFVVSLTPATGDQGADIVLYAKNKKIVIQAKFYTGSVGNFAVQEVFSAKSYYDADECMVVSSSKYTSSAKILANKIGVILADDCDFIELIKNLIE